MWVETKTASRMARLAVGKQYFAWVLCPRIMVYAVVSMTSFWVWLIGDFE
jgi:hypothetical protein